MFPPDSLNRNLTPCARISEVEPDDDCWPFTDTVFVVGALHADELAAELSGLEPDEVSSAKYFGIPDALAQKYTSPILVAWWD
jgi:hypothetical protein